MPLRNDLLNPISAGKPSGENLKYAPAFDKIKEARREDDDAPQGDWKVERKVADWPLTIKLISDALATKTKDLQLAAWLAEAMLRREGVAGLREVLDLIRGLLENFWEDLYPELDEGDAELRAAPLQWLGDRLDAAVKKAPLTRSGLDWFQYKESRTVGSEETADTDEKQRTRLEAIAEGKLSQEQFDKAFEETPKKYYVSLLEAFDGSLESLGSLGEVCDGKFGDVTPSFATLKRVLEEVRQTVYILLQVKREKEPDEPVAAPAPEPEAEAAEEPAAQAPTRAAAAAPARKGGALSAEPVDRDDAIGRVAGAARFLRHQEPYSPAPYLMLRGLRWGELRAAGNEVDQMLLAAPSSEIRQNLKRLSLEGNWAEVLEAAETAMAMECGRGWLDLQRYVGRACSELGADHDPIRNAVISELRALLMDYPKLTDLTMMDDTATANAETQAWIHENVLVSPEHAYTPVSYQPDSVDGTGTGAPAPPDTFEMAVKAARSGRQQEAIQLLLREMVQEPSGRGRFYRKVQLTKLCDVTGLDAIAFPILQELAAEIERRKLEDWEPAEMVAEPLALLHRCLTKTGGDADEIQKLYSWICRLDPLQAMNISR